MRVTNGPTLEELTSIADDLGMCLNNFHTLSSRTVSFTLRPIPDSTRYKRRSQSTFRPNRYVRAICWHGHYEFMHRILEQSPNAKIATHSPVGNPGALVYDGLDDFLDKAIETQYIDVGSMFRPVEWGELCDCHRGF